MKVKDLKSGYVVKVSCEFDGDFFGMICENKDGQLCLSSQHHWFPINCFDDNLRYGSKQVVEVYGRANNMHCWKVSKEGRGLIWEYQVPKEITVNEIEELLGYKIIIIEGEE